MFLLGSPTNDRVRRILKSQARSPFSYSDTGATRTLLPAEYEAQREQFLLGEGSRVFYKAKEAARQWRMFDIDWVRLYHPKPIAHQFSVCGNRPQLCNPPVRGSACHAEPSL
jgi:hypothetical protein